MASVPPTASLATQASWSRRADSSVWLPSRNSRASGVDHSGASTSERATTATTTSSAPASAMVRRKPGRVSIQPDVRVDQRRVVVLPAGLVLLGAAVVVDGDHLPAGLPRRGGQVERRLAHPAADLEQRPGDGDRAGRLVQGAALVVGHEARARPGAAARRSVLNCVLTGRILPAVRSSAARWPPRPWCRRPWRRTRRPPW